MSTTLAGQRADYFLSRWAEYRRLRRRLWLSCAGFVIMAGIGAIFSELFPQTPTSTIRNLVAIVIVCAAFAVWVIGAVTTFRLYSWQCPQCGEPFARGAMHFWPGRYCNHCGISVGAT